MLLHSVQQVIEYNQPFSEYFTSVNFKNHLSLLTDFLSENFLTVCRHSVSVNFYVYERVFAKS